MLHPKGGYLDVVRVLTDSGIAVDRLTFGMVPNKPLSGLAYASSEGRVSCACSSSRGVGVDSRGKRGLTPLQQSSLIRAPRGLTGAGFFSITAQT